MNWALLPGAERVYGYNVLRHHLVRQGASRSASIALLRSQHISGRPRSFSNSSVRGVIPWRATAYSSPVLRHIIPQSPLTKVSLRGSAWNIGLSTGGGLTAQAYAPKTSWLQSFYSRARMKDGVSIRYMTSTSRAARKVKEDEISKTAPGALGAASKHVSAKGLSAGKEDASEKRLFDRLPDLSNRFHRPTKEELLAAANGFWSRMTVRFKWLTIRSSRPFNSDDLSAFFSWIIVGHVIWIIVGTTTFFSLLILMVNTVFAQETLARWIGNYLTKSSGVKVVFESAIVPKWRDGVITFRNVFVSRRPGQKEGTVTKGSPIAAAAAAAAAERSTAHAINEDEENTKYTQFDLTLETINVTLSFAKWLNGKGLLRDVEIKGVRGVVDRSNLRFSTEYVDPRTFKHHHVPGDFEIDSFKLEDLLVSIYQPRNFRPFSVSIFSADLPQLRKQWLFYDLLSANHVSGSFDESLFTIHPRQVHNYTGAQLSDGAGDESQTHWKKQSRIRIDGLKIDHLNRGVSGPFSWIHEGNADIVADIMFPVDNDESISRIISDFYERMEEAVTSSRHVQPTFQATRPHTSPTDPSNIDNSTPSSSAPTTSPSSHTHDHDNRFLILDLRIHLNSVHAFVPLFNRDLSYINNALIRPIVAYINSNKQFIPLNCRVVKRASEFDGSWTLYDSGLMEDLNREAYEAFAKDIGDEQARMRRIRKVGLWSLQLAVQALFLGLAGHLA